MLLLAGLLLVPAVLAGRKISAATEAAGAMAQGDLSQPIPDAAGREESSRLVQALAGMQQGVGAIVHKVQESVVHIDATAAQLGATSREQAATAHAMNASAVRSASSGDSTAPTSRNTWRTSSAE